jgi:hypothetical protein
MPRRRAETQAFVPALQFSKSEFRRNAGEGAAGLSNSKQIRIIEREESTKTGRCFEFALRKFDNCFGFVLRTSNLMAIGHREASGSSF